MEVLTETNQIEKFHNQIMEMNEDQPKIIYTVGIPGCGKSTFISELFQHSPHNYWVVCPDKIRESLTAIPEKDIQKKYYESPDQNLYHRRMNDIMIDQIYKGLEKGKIILLDRTHLLRDDINMLKQFNVLCKPVIFDIDLNITKERNGSRTRVVPDEVIDKMFQRFRDIKKKMTEDPEYFSFKPVPLENDMDSKKKRVILVDIDGTLAEKGKRNPFDEKRVSEDEPRMNIINLANLYYEAGYKIIFTSGRTSNCFGDTLIWLNDYLDFYIPADDLLMRDPKDSRPDWMVKEDMWREIIKNHRIQLLIDDRNQVVRRARSLGLEVLQVQNGDF